MLRRLVAADRKLAVVASFHLTLLETYILGAVLAVALGVQLNVTISAHAHDALTAVILLLGAVVQPISGAQFVAKLPPGVVTLIQAALGAVVILAQSWQLASGWLTVLGVVIVAANTLGLGPTTPVKVSAVPVPIPAPVSAPKASRTKRA